MTRQQKIFSSVGEVSHETKTLFHSSYLSSYPWSSREGQVIALAAPFLWFCAQRSHVRWDSCEGRCYYPAERLCCGLEGMKENICGRGQSCLSFHCYYWFEMLLLWGLFICAPHCPRVVLWWLIQSRWQRLSVTENCSSKCLWGLSPSSWQLSFRITSIM